MSKSLNTPRRLPSGLIVAGVALVVLLVQLLQGVRLADGHWVYSLDDAYIHLVLARNLAFHGMLGMAPDDFAACSSSPLWTVLLASAMKLVGARDWLPGLLNFAFTLLALLAVDRILARRDVSAWRRVGAGLAFFFLVPLTVIASTGMEHVMHVLITVLFLWAGMYELERPATSGAKAVVLPVLAFLMTGARYESLFIIAPFTLVLLLKRRWKAAFLMAVAGLLPVVLHGVYSLAHGGLFLPNSLVLKGRIPGGGWLRHVFQAFSMYVSVTLQNVHLHIICILLLLTACFRRVPESVRLPGLVVVAAAIGHVTFSRCGHFYRYEAYLVAAGYLLLMVAWLPPDRLPLRHIIPSPVRHDDNWLLLGRTCLLLFLLTPLVLRGLWATSRVPRGSANIYQQQWQMARIFRTMDLEGKAVGINDLGLMADRSGARVIDLWGLGTTEVARAKWEGRFGRDFLADLFARHNIGYVAVFDEWFDMGRQLPLTVIPVARLTIEKSLVCAFATVKFYATGPEEEKKLREHLGNLPFELPRGTHLELLPAVSSPAAEHSPKTPDQ
ncbi:MAG: hypothetical protein GX174_01750 [Lentisphaerae bacterium]|jgi:hypothetical protein|nr:hypothetical protein [Lentisphaerota bacterium]